MVRYSGPERPVNFCNLIRKIYPRVSRALKSFCIRREVTHSARHFVCPVRAD